MTEISTSDIIPATTTDEKGLQILNFDSKSALRLLLQSPHAFHVPAILIKPWSGNYLQYQGEDVECFWDPAPCMRRLCSCSCSQDHRDRSHTLSRYAIFPTLRYLSLFEHKYTDTNHVSHDRLSKWETFCGKPDISCVQPREAKVIARHLCLKLKLRANLYEEKERKKSWRQFSREPKRQDQGRMDEISRLTMRIAKF